MSVPPKPVAAFALSLVAGVFILLGSAVMSMFALGVPEMMMGGTEGMHVGTGMTGSMMGGMMMTWMLGSVPVLAAFGIASGIMVILGSVMLYTRSAENHLWGAIILTFSVVSILGSMGGLLAGLVLGMLGGSRLHGPIPGSLFSRPALVSRLVPSPVTWFPNRGVRPVSVKLFEAVAISGAGRKSNKMYLQDHNMLPESFEKKLRRGFFYLPSLRASWRSAGRP